VHLPATAEQFYWGGNGNAFGVSGNYLGVSWFSTKVNVPASFKNKHIFISCIAGVKDKKRAEGDGENAAMSTFNAQAVNPANVVGQQLLLNMLSGE
jgi:hypothetical protein